MKQRQIISAELSIEEQRVLATPYTWRLSNPNKKGEIGTRYRSQKCKNKAGEYNDQVRFVNDHFS